MVLQVLAMLLLQALHFPLRILMQKTDLMPRKILMSRKLNILMSHKNDFYNVTKVNFLMFQKQVMQYIVSPEFCNTWVKDDEVAFLIGLYFVG